MVTYLVTYPDPEKGIVSPFPLWILPIVIASLVSIFFYWKEKRKAAPLAYVIGTLGVLIGADCLHLINLLHNQIHTTRIAIIGGANVLHGLHHGHPCGVPRRPLDLPTKKKKR